VIARKGNSDSYEPAFTQPLSEGTEFRVVEVRSGWLNARISEDQTGWIRQRDAQLF
jgi:hypothetical protein